MTLLDEPFDQLQRQVDSAHVVGHVDAREHPRMPLGALGGQCEVCPGHLPFLEADDDIHKAARSSRLQGHHHR